MTTPESPSALLERAAAKLEELAAHFADYVDADVPGISRWDTPAESWSYDAVDRNASSSSRAWIETVNPSVAPPLVEWLRETVEQYRAEHSRHSVPSEALDRAWMRHPAVRFARLVLGEPENMP